MENMASYFSLNRVKRIPFYERSGYMLIYLLIGLLVLVGIIICCKGVITKENFTPSEICLWAIIILGISMCWPLFIAYLIIEMYKGR